MHGPRRIRGKAALPPAATMAGIEKVSTAQALTPDLSFHIKYLLLLFRVGMSEDTTSNKSAVQKSDFRILRTIGRGTYGKVYLVQHN